MRTSWQLRDFEDCLTKLTYTNKIQRKNFLESGEFPVVSQEIGTINGYWNDKRDLFLVKKPVIIFGDHTQILKYIDFDFVLGADGVKILQTKDGIDSKFFFYFLQSVTFKQLGYARHYRLLKEIQVPIPLLAEQKRTVKILDEKFAQIEELKRITEQQIKNSRELFESYAQSIFLDSKKDWSSKSIGEVCDLMTGGTPSRGHLEYFQNGKIKWLVSGDIHKKEIFDCEGRITKEGYESSNAKFLPINSVLIALNGQGKTRGSVALLRVKATCNQSLVSIYPKKIEELLPEYLYQALNSRYQEIRKLTGDAGNDRRGLNMPIIRSIRISFPSVPDQKVIVKKLDALSAETKNLEAIYKQKLVDLEELKKSVLQKAFAGEL
ncbi:MAG: restriction endonuclease subunit S [Patescibacteria group bacterium]